MRHYFIATLVFFTLFFSACNESKFKIEGNIEGAQGQTMVLEKSDFNGNWVAVDSVKIGDSGNFSISSESPVSPEIYRLSLGKSFVYLPVDSIETLSLSSTAEGFGRDYTLTGTDQAELLTSFEKELMDLDAGDSAALSEFKKNVYSKYIREGKGSILSYYVLTKYFKGKPLYNPEDLTDAKYYAAVATQFENYRPDDPHGKMVKSVSLEAMRRRNSAQGKKTVIKAGQLSVIDIDLPDISGTNVKLSDIVGKGKPVILVFSMMNDNESPALNRDLASFFKARNGNILIYQVSFDSDLYEWREAARNLPWINVIDPQAMSSTALRDYNVGALPAFFIYDSSGELIDRAETVQELKNKI